MTINSIALNNNTVFAGLGTSTYTVVTAGLYTLGFQSFIPYNPAGSSYRSDQIPPTASALQVVINQNGSPVLTIGGVANNPTPTQPIMNGQVELQCAVNDVLTVVLTSSAPADNLPNGVKTILNLRQGN